eukprot:6062908-Prorocentrum_lima.AAC.1
MSPPRQSPAHGGGLQTWGLVWHVLPGHESLVVHSPLPISSLPGAQLEGGLVVRVLEPLHPVALAQRRAPGGDAIPN